MTSAWFLGASEPVTQDDSDVRATIEPIRDDPGLAESDESNPGFNEFESDKSDDLNGLAPRMVAGNVTESIKSPPVNESLMAQNHNAVIDNQVASSGTAAARESAGERGHGSMEYTVSLTPEIRDGAAFGNDYFQASQPPVQEGMGEYMTAVENDHWAQQVAQAYATQSSRDAYMSTMYNGFLGG